MDPYFEDEIDFSLPLKKKKKKKPICVSASEATVVKECNIVPCPMNELTDSDSMLGLDNMSVDQTKESNTPNNSPKSGEEIFYSDDDMENLNNSLDKSEEIFYSDGDLETVGKENSPSKTVDSVPQFGSMISDVNVSLAVDFESALDFSLPKKKKKKKPIYISENTDPETDKHIIAPKIFDLLPTDIEADYTHEYLLIRIFKKMREKNPLIDEAERNKVVIKPPQIIRVGTKRSSFVNFLELCKIMHRTPAHLQSFLLVELGTTGSIDGNGHLLIKGKFQQKQVESVLRRYIKEYVTCHSCHSPSTVLLKETRLYFIKCESCGSQSSVPVIKSGYQAVINKRAATRSKVSN